MGLKERVVIGQTRPDNERTVPPLRPSSFRFGRLCTAFAGDTNRQTDRDCVLESIAVVPGIPTAIEIETEECVLVRDSRVGW